MFFAVLFQLIALLDESPGEFKRSDVCNYLNTMNGYSKCVTNVDLTFDISWNGVCSQRGCIPWTDFPFFPKGEQAAYGTVFLCMCGCVLNLLKIKHFCEISCTSNQFTTQHCLTCTNCFVLCFFVCILFKYIQLCKHTSHIQNT